MGGEIAVLAVFALCVLLFLGNLGLAGLLLSGLAAGLRVPGSPCLAVPQSNGVAGQDRAPDAGWQRFQ